MNRLLLSLFRGILPALILLVIAKRWLAEPENTAIQASDRMPTKVTPAASTESLLDLWMAGTSVFPIIQTMTMEEAEAAFHQAARFETGYPKERIRQMAFDRWAEGDPQGALQATGIYLPEEDRLTMISPIVQRWAVDDPDACLD
ncbi:MAG: hypothetical protein ACI8T1_004345 [Verrucomicrobiales bacterium]|jgi:hypothetical protein